jgi:hypothetical protein
MYAVKVGKAAPFVWAIEKRRVFLRKRLSYGQKDNGGIGFLSGNRSIRHWVVRLF